MAAVKKRVAAMEYIRGIAMLGVIGIHTGAYSLSNPAVDVHMFALLEVASRFSVPIFFFVSAFGLFYGKDLNEPQKYGSFLLRRGRSILIPYLSWSVLYMGQYTYLNNDWQYWEAPKVYEMFFFGLTQYHLYWLIILMWFYLLMPLWRVLLKAIIDKPVPFLSILFVAQIAFDYYSSYILKPNFADEYLNMFVRHRLNYVVFHYIFIFLLGAVFALRYEEVCNRLKRYTWTITGLFIGSLVWMLGWYYDLLQLGNSPEQAVWTVHQLSPAGVLYTAASAFFLTRLFSSERIPQSMAAFLAMLGHYSYAVYLIHPLVMYYIVEYFEQAAIVMTLPAVAAFFITAIIGSIGIAWMIERGSRKVPIIGQILVGAGAGKK